MRRTLCLVTSLSFVLLLAASVDARGYRRATMQRGYHATGEYDVLVSGKPVEAEVLFSQRAATYILVFSGKPNAIVLRQRSRTVGDTPASGLSRKDDGTVELPRSAVVRNLGRFWLSGMDVVIRSSHLDVRLRPRKPLLKAHDHDAMLKHSPQYAVQMRGYRPSAQLVAKLKNRTGEVEVFFGSWCSRCQRLLGHVLRLEQELGADSKIKFVYYGLPRPPAAWREPHYRASGVHGLPTAVVKAGGRVRGRIAHGSWSSFEYSLLPLLK